MGPIRRCDIVQPSAPVALHVNQTVTTLYQGQTYQACVQEPWVAPSILPLTGVDTKLAVLFEVERTISHIPRDDMIPFPPTPIHLNDQFQANYITRITNSQNKIIQKALLLQRPQLEKLPVYSPTYWHKKFVNAF